jgi:predicted metal-dependent hydrolase
LSVEDGEVLVKAPWFVPAQDVEAFVQSKREWIEKRLRQWEERRRWYYLLGKRRERRGEDVEELWRQTTLSLIVPRAWELAKLFGEEPKAIKVSKAKRRWGSCSSKGVINLSYRLAQLPNALIDYVIVHELCHLRHMDHSKAFWREVEARYPSYRQAHKELKNFF